MYERKSMNKPWSDLPNAHHIDWVLGSLKENSQTWAKIWAVVRETVPSTTRKAARDEAWRLARDATWRSAVVAASVVVAGDEAYSAAKETAWAVLRRSIASGGAYDAIHATGDPLLALVAYDDCDQYLDMGYVKLRTYATLSERPQALLLLPMAYVREKINEQALV
jgi:hypothetical protein